MANTLTNLIPDLYEALDIVSRELVGFIPAVTMDTSAERAALNQTIRVPITPAATASDITPSVTVPDTGDQTIGNNTITITKERGVPFRWTGGEQRGVNHGPGYPSIRVNQMAQAFRTLTNEVEADLAGLYTRASRAYGTAGTTPFASSLADSAQALKILKDNGAPETDLHLIIDTTAGVNLRTLANLTRANEAGGDSLLRQGILLPLHGMAIRESAGVKLHTAGTGSGYLINNGSGLAVGATTIDVDTGSGTVIVGDVVSTAGISHKYVVDSALSGGSFGIQDPGLRAAVANNDAVSVSAAYRANMAFHRSAMVLVTRAPDMPEEGDEADDVEMITDARSGLSFEVAMYKTYRRVHYQVGLAWGVACIKPEHTALLLG